MTDDTRARELIAKWKAFGEKELPLIGKTLSQRSTASDDIVELTTVAEQALANLAETRRLLAEADLVLACDWDEDTSTEHASEADIKERDRIMEAGWRRHKARTGGVS